MSGEAAWICVAIAALTFASAGSEDICLGELSMDGSGSPGYILGGPPGRVEGDTLTLPHNSGFSVMTACSQTWEPYEFFQFKVLDRTLSFTVDLSKVGCGCNLALYMVQAPGLDRAGDPSIGQCEEDSPYYCDANKVCGQWCPEMDIMEANIKAFQATPHSCDAPDAAGHYSNCDRSGCGLSTRDTPNSYGPGGSYQIDTTKPFDVETTWKANNMITKLVQGANVVTLDHSMCGASLGGMAAAMTSGMSIRITYWGKKAETMAWLDSPPCGPEVCTGDNAGNATISNLRVTPTMPAQTTFPTTKTETTTTTLTTTTTTTPTPFTFNPVLLGFACYFVLGAVLLGALGIAIYVLAPRILKNVRDPFDFPQAGSERPNQGTPWRIDRTSAMQKEPYVYRAVLCAVVCMIFAFLLAWYPAFQATHSSPTPETVHVVRQDTTQYPPYVDPRTQVVSTTIPTVTAPTPQVVATEGCCSWDGGKTCGENTDYCMSKKSHCEEKCSGKWKVGS